MRWCFLNFHSCSSEEAGDCISFLFRLKKPRLRKFQTRSHVYFCVREQSGFPYFTKCSYSSVAASQSLLAEGELRRARLSGDLFCSILIFMALKNSKTGSLPVSEIYNFMTEHFPYFKVSPKADPVGKQERLDPNMLPVCPR